MPLLAVRPRLLRAARVAVAAALTVAGAAACSESTAPDASVGGLYTLIAFDNAAVPVSNTNAAGTLRSELTGGQLILRGDRTFEISIDVRETDLVRFTIEEFTETQSGRYSVRGNTITFSNTVDRELDNATATVSGNTITLGSFTFRQ